MTTYRRVTLELAKYRPDWYSAMHLIDMATWLNNWHGHAVVDIYIASLAEKRVAHTPDGIEKASRLAKAAYLAIDGPTAKQILTNPYCRIMIDLAVDARREEGALHQIAVENLVRTLRLLLPGSPYNSRGGATDGRPSGQRAAD